MSAISFFSQERPFDLPDDIFSLILDFLPTKDLLTVSRVSRAFRAHALDDNRWAKRWAALSLSLDDIRQDVPVWKQYLRRPRCMYYGAWCLFSRSNGIWIFNREKRAQEKGVVFYLPSKYAQEQVARLEPMTKPIVIMLFSQDAVAFDADGAMYPVRDYRPTLSPQESACFNTPRPEYCADLANGHQMGDEIYRLDHFIFLLKTSGNSCAIRPRDDTLPRFPVSFSICSSANGWVNHTVPVQEEDILWTDHPLWHEAKWSKFEHRDAEALDGNSAYFRHLGE